MQDQQERQYHRNYSKLQWQPLELHDELRSIENWLGCAQTQLAWLEKINAFSSMFGIRQDGPLAVINDFRLGCLPTVPMCWNEMNSAWGQTALLLLALSNIVGQEFQRYGLIPCGNHSYLKSLTEGPTELPVFCTRGPSALLSNKFDRVKMAFLDCMKFKEETEKGKPGLCMP